MTTTEPEFLEFRAELLDAAPDPTTPEAHSAGGLGLPYGELLARTDLRTGARRQVYAPGSGKVREDAKFYYGHDHQLGGMPIGLIAENRHEDAGLRLRTRFAKTTKAAEVLALMTPDTDGKAVLDRFSVGYLQAKNHLDTEGEYGGTEEDPVLVHDEVDIFEVSVVPLAGFHNSALVDSVLSAQPQQRPPTRTTPQKEGTMTELLDAPTSQQFDALSADVQALTGSLGDLDRRIATLGAGTDGDPAPSIPGASYGEFLQMLAAGDREAAEFLAYTGGVIGDLGDWVKDSWVGDIYRPITERRRLHQLFESAPLPASGMNVEYGKLDADTTDVDVQAAEGDVLAYGKISFETATAPILTYGGWGDMSRQEIQRSGVNVVEKFFSALVNRYAQATEAALRTVVANVANSHALVEGSGVTDLTTPDGYTGFVLDAAFWLEDKGLVPEFILLGRDKFKELALMRQDGADGDYFMDRASGSVNITGLSGNVFSLPVIPVNSAGLVRVGHSSAIRTFEDGRAPFRMQDSDITNLTDAFSIYGYEAIAVQDADALVSPDVTA